MIDLIKKLFKFYSGYCKNGRKLARQIAKLFILISIIRLQDESNMKYTSIFFKDELGKNYDYLNAKIIF